MLRDDGDGGDFARTWAAFEQGKIEALDAVDDLGPDGNGKLVRCLRTVVSITDDNGYVSGRLNQATENGDLVPVFDRNFPPGG